MALVSLFRMLLLHSLSSRNSPMNEKDYGIIATITTTTTTTTRKLFAPRVIFLETTAIQWNILRNNTTSSITETSNNGTNQIYDDRYYDKYREVSEEEQTRCHFLAPWQYANHVKPTCNMQHEMASFGDASGVVSLKSMAIGGFKAVWNIMDESGISIPAVLKTIRYDNLFVARNAAKSAKDALVMEATTSSPYVLDIYSYCAFSSLVERAHGTLENWLREHHSSNEGVDSVMSQQLLRIAYMLAQGVASIQLYTNMSGLMLPTFAHADIKTSQFLMTQSGDAPIFKINDFDRGRFLTYSPIHNSTVCPFRIVSKHKGSTMRSPEEYTRGGSQTDKVDIFALGSVFYRMLANQVPFADLDFQDAITKIKLGKEPELPMAIQHSTNPSEMAIVTAMRTCRQLKPDDRPNSRSIAKLLQDALEKVDAIQAD